MQLSWLPSRSRHRSWVNDCICRRQLLEVTQKQNMLLILVPATCNGQICRRRIKYACEAGAKARETPLDPAQHKVRARAAEEGGGVINFATAFETQTQPDTGQEAEAAFGHGFPSGSLNAANILRSPCSRPNWKFSLCPHTHTQTHIIHVDISISAQPWQTNELTGSQTGQTAGQTYRITFGWGRAGSACCWLFCNDFITQPETSNATDCSASKGCFMKCAAQPDISIFIQFAILEIPLRLKVVPRVIPVPLAWSRVYWLIRRNADYTMRTMFRIIFHFINFPASCTCARPFCLLRIRSVSHIN